MEHLSKQGFIDIYFNSYKSELVDEFSAYPSTNEIDYDEFVGIIKNTFSDELDYWLDEEGNVDEDNFSFGGFINDIKNSLKDKFEK